MFGNMAGIENINRLRKKNTTGFRRTYTFTIHIKLTALNLTRCLANSKNNDLFRQGNPFPVRLILDARNRSILFLIRIFLFLLFGLEQILTLHSMHVDLPSSAAVAVRVNKFLRQCTHGVKISVSLFQSRCSFCSLLLSRERSTLFSLLVVLSCCLFIQREQTI